MPDETPVVEVASDAAPEVAAEAPAVEEAKVETTPVEPAQEAAPVDEAPAEVVAEVAAAPQVEVQEAAPAEVKVERLENKTIVAKAWVDKSVIPWLPDYVEISFADGTKTRVPISYLVSSGISQP